MPLISHRPLPSVQYLSPAVAGGARHTRAATNASAAAQDVAVARLAAARDGQALRLRGVLMAALPPNLPDLAAPARPGPAPGGQSPSLWQSVPPIGAWVKQVS